jgi:ubiquinone biosynthesis protein
MSEQIGWRGLLNHIKAEAPQWAALLPALPRLAHQALARDSDAKLSEEVARLTAEQARQSRLLMLIALLLAGMLGAVLSL